LWGSHRRLKECHLPDSSGTTELAYGLRVYLKNVCNRKMIDVTTGLRAHARRRIVRA
jgi:hypothetical protein